MSRKQAAVATPTRVSDSKLVPTAIAGCVVGLAVWWFALKRASLYLMYFLAYVPLLFSIGPNGLKPVSVNDQTHEWTFNIALNMEIPNPDTGKLQHVGSMEYGTSEDSIAYFVSGWVVYLALSFAAGGFSKGRWMATLKGLGLQVLLSVLALIVYAYVNGHGSAYSELGNHGAAVWWLRWVYHIDYLVVPFFGPFIIALSIHRAWRDYLLPKLGSF